MQAQGLGMMTFTELPSVPSDHLVPFTDQLRLAVAAYLARFKGSSRYHTESDLRCYPIWCVKHGVDPLAAPPTPKAIDPVDARGPLSADAQLDDGGVVDGEDAGAGNGPAGGFPAGPWCAWWRLGGQSAVTSAAAVRALVSSTMALRPA